MDNRLSFIEVAGKGKQSTFCVEVDTGLSEPQKWLPTRYLYDHHGSEIFEAITELPEYYLTGCEAEILETHADEIIRGCDDLTTIVEFGSGSSKKTRLILEAALRAHPEITYVPIDISADFLRETSSDLLNRYPRLKVEAIAAEYFDAADALPPSKGGRLILFLGSNIGNLTHEEAIDFMSRVQKQMGDHDHLLMGVDLVKDPAIIEAAYNDEQGVTANFNCNLLARINKELNGNFDLTKFRHYAPYLEAEHRVEMRLYSLADQTVEIDAVGKTFTFDMGEFIHTEWSHKYTLDSFGALAAEAGLEIDEVWFDSRKWFGFMTLKRHGA